MKDSTAIMRRMKDRGLSKRQTRPAKETSKRLPKRRRKLSMTQLDDETMSQSMNTMARKRRDYYMMIQSTYYITYKYSNIQFNPVILNNDDPNDIIIVSVYSYYKIY